MHLSPLLTYSFNIDWTIEIGSGRIDRVKVVRVLSFMDSYWMINFLGYFDGLIINGPDDLSSSALRDSVGTHVHASCQTRSCMQ